MAIEIVKNIDFSKIAEEVRDGVFKEMKLAMTDEAAEIEHRTSTGKDADNRAFEKYTDAYKRFRVEGRKTRSGKRAGGGRRGTPVDLNFSGAMFRAMQHEARRVGKQIVGRIYFASAEAGAKALGNMKKRRFFALSRKQVDKITQRINERIGKILNGNR